ncbi:putative protein serine/threonine phosphatase [Magnetofaba australis IT-1]|uniref:PPM-type phosphatase domain-containing protein n=2 Tax=Magnetofaba TaxID=1472292 RepID=A0A1Y2KAT6_9PROT|nr:putative protein serine/threonine phosphatase [Magnetofaba australis IT-1]
MVVSDGMGGHDHGEVASREVIAALREYLMSPGTFGRKQTIRSDDTYPDEAPTVVNTIATAETDDEEEDGPTQDDVPNPAVTLVRHAVEYANSKVFEENQKRKYPEGTGMGATVAGLWLSNYEDRLVVFHVGDSRVYRFREGDFSQVTRDHSMIQQWRDFGERGAQPSQNILTQAMGPAANVVPDVALVDDQAGDCYLICSDGLSNMVDDAVLAEKLGKATEENLEEIGDELIELAKHNGGKDNITLILGLVVA